MPSLNACNAILDTLIESTKRGKFCVSLKDILYTSLASKDNSGVITKYKA